MNDALRDERERGWFHLDNAVIDEYLPKIGVTAFAVYACIVRHSDRAGNAFPSYSTLQKELGCGRSQVAAAIKKIVDAGLVTITTGKRASNLYHIVTISTSPKAELVPIQNQSHTGTGTSSGARPELVPIRDSNNTQLTRPKEQDSSLVNKDRGNLPARPRVASAAPQTFVLTVERYETVSEFGTFDEVRVATDQWRDTRISRGQTSKDWEADWRAFIRAYFERQRARAPTNGHRPVTYAQQGVDTTEAAFQEVRAIVLGSNGDGVPAVRDGNATDRGIVPRRNPPADHRGVLD